MSRLPAKDAEAWSQDNALTYFSNSRSSAEDLYDSEVHFMEEALRGAETLLDIGCATGGASKVVRHYNPSVKYTGVDVTLRMIEEAQRRFPGDNFQVCDGERLEFGDGAFDVCMSMGVFHMTIHWRKLLSEAWRVCRNSLLFDLRLTSAEGTCDPAASYMKIAYDGEWDGSSKVPYIVTNVGDAAEALACLRPGFKELKAYGYYHPVSSMTVSPHPQVCMAAFLLEKTGASTEIDWRLPVQCPKSLSRLGESQ